MTKIISPLSGFPYTQEKFDENGDLYYEIVVDALTPKRAEWADDLRRYMGWLFTGLFLWGLVGNAMHVGLKRVNVVDFVEMAVFFFVAHWLLSRGIRNELKKDTLIVMDLTTVKARTIFSRWKAFNRDIDHRFVCLPHDMTAHEAKMNDFAVRRAAKNNRVLSPPVYYGESAHVILDYAGSRVDLVEVFDKRYASAIAARLQYCDRALDAFAKKRIGWGDEPEWDVEEFQA